MITNILHFVPLFALGPPRLVSLADALEGIGNNDVFHLLFLLLMLPLQSSEFSLVTRFSFMIKAVQYRASRGCIVGYLIINPCNN
jgi:hypothetical protein